MMAEYRLTTKGKIVVSIYLSLLLLLIALSGKYIIDYAQNTGATEIDSNMPFNSSDSNKMDDENVISEDETLKIVVEPTKIEEDMEPVFESEAHVYTKNELEILRQSSIVLYFDAQSFKISEDDYDKLKEFMGIATQFPEEIISVVGHSNGYPNFENTVLEESLSRDRANVVRKFLIDNGLSSNRLIVSYYGSNSPVTIDFEDQFLNDRVIVYFRDHIVTSEEDK